MILVTGAAGLIGRHLCKRLEAAGLPVRRFDWKSSATEDICNPEALAAALNGVTGVIHLAAVSRVVWAERNPALCTAINVDALAGLVDACLNRARPWLIFASSREVYGNPGRLPVHEDDALQPINVYGRSKRDGELIVQSARDSGLLANVCRFSNVYGCPLDYEDRVAMAFAAAAARGGAISVEGSANTFDFTHVADVVDGLWLMVQATMHGERLPPVQFVSGQATTLGELAQIAASQAIGRTRVDEAPPRDFDVTAFVGDPARAKALLGWSVQTGLREGMSDLIASLARTQTS